MFAAEPGRAIFWATSPETDLSFIYKTAFLSLFQRAFLLPRYGYLLRALMGVKDVKGSYSCSACAGALDIARNRSSHVTK